MLHAHHMRTCAWSVHYSNANITRIGALFALNIWYIEQHSYTYQSSLNYAHMRIGTWLERHFGYIKQHFCAHQSSNYAIQMQL